MKILVTGGSGYVGRHVVSRLLRRKHQVRVIGHRPTVDMSGVEYASCDVADHGLVCEQMRDMQAVVHLAGIAHPALDAASELFHINAGGTYNIYEAAAQAGVRRIVNASSVAFLGFCFGVQRTPFRHTEQAGPIRYFPIDEDHPSFTSDPYSFSKRVLELIADYYWRRDGITSVSLRLPAVFDGNLVYSEPFRRQWTRARNAMSAILEMEPAARAGRAAQLVSRYDTLRRERAFESGSNTPDWEDSDAGFMRGYGFFWSVIDVRDVARAVCQALTADITGSHGIYVNADRNLLDLDSRALAATFFPDVRIRGREIKGSDSLVSNERARKLIGFRPRHAL